MIQISVQEFWKWYSGSKWDGSWEGCQDQEIFFEQWGDGSALELRREDTPVNDKFESLAI